MEDYKNPPPAKCLNCGNAIGSAGRCDRKFCCDSCRNSYNNRRHMALIGFRKKTDRKLNANYSFLRALLDNGVESIPLQDAVAGGFDTNYATAVFRCGKKVDYNCFDIGYRISESRIFRIHQLELSLQNNKKIK